MLTKIALYLFCVLIFACGAQDALGQEPGAQATATPDPELIKLQKELALEKARTDLAVQKKATLTAILPTASNDPANKNLTGESKVSDEENKNNYETESVALDYAAVAIVAKQLSSKLQSG